MVELPDLPGKELVGALYIPSNLSNQVNITLITSYFDSIEGTSFNEQSLASTVLNITLFDGQGNSITKLDSPLTICLALPNKERGQRVCLSYYDERKDKWRCEDKCLTTIASKGTKSSNSNNKEESLLCGQTDHLTNFALLLIGSERDDPCQHSRDDTISWISLGMVGGAVLLVAFSGLVVEFQIRRRRIKLDRELAKAFSPNPIIGP